MELKFQRFLKLLQSVFQNLKQDMCSVAVFSRRENPPPSIFALANPSTQTKKIRFISVLYKCNAPIKNSNKKTMFLCGKTTPQLKFQRFIQLSKSVFQNLKQNKFSVAVFSRRENPPPSIFALANPSTQTKKIRFISAPLSGPVSSAFQQLQLREPQPPSSSFQKQVQEQLKFQEQMQ